MTTLQAATVTLDSADVVLTFTLDGAAPESGHWTAATTFVAGPDGPIDHVGFKILDGSPVAAWTHDLSDGGGQHNYNANPQRLGDTWTLVLPREAVRSSSGTWRASIDVNSADGGPAIEGRY